MQACQTAGSANRGVGIYSKFLFETIASSATNHDIYALTSNGHDINYIPNNIYPTHVVRTNSLPDFNSNRSYDNGERDSLDGILIGSLCQRIKPDIIHISHPFEGLNERVGIFDHSLRSEGQIISATLYDLIPLIFKDHYFKDHNFRRWYYHRLAWIQKADLLLSISESTRQDAINLLGIEPWRIVNINGGFSNKFRPSSDRLNARNRLCNNFELREKLVLYTGGDDYRKNIEGAIRAFSLIDSSLRSLTQLVIVCSIQPDRRQYYLKIARKHGLVEGDLLFTGYVDDQVLIDFYCCCDLFVFPSLYEGLGLPVLEAMACGAPVIGANNSSIRDLIVRNDALFDTSNDDEFARLICHVLNNDNFSNDLREYSKCRAADFNWKSSAECALSAFDDALSRARESNIQSVSMGLQPRKQLAVLTPLPPSRSGIADYNEQFLPFLARHFDIDLFVVNSNQNHEILSSQFRIFDVASFDRVATEYDIILYELGNSEFHAHMLPLIKKFPGVVGLHDAYLSGLFGYVDFYMGNTGSYEKEMLLSHGPIARQYFSPSQAYSEPIHESMVHLPCTKKILDNAIGVISHSYYNLTIAKTFYPEGWKAPYRIIPQMVVLPSSISDVEREKVRSELGFHADDFIVATFGHIAWTKCGDRLLDAYMASILAKDPKSKLIFVGELSNDEFGLRLRKCIKLSGLSERITITGYLSAEDYIKYLRATDLGIQLRTNSRGGTPKGVLDCLAYEIPVIVNNDASYKDYPDDVVIKLCSEPNYLDISKKLDEVFLNVSTLSEYKKNGRKYVASHHAPSISATLYASALHDFTARETVNKETTLIKKLAKPVGAVGANEIVGKISNWYNNINEAEFRRRRIYVDVSHIAEENTQTGIHRVVKEIVNALYINNTAGFDPIAVILKNGELLEAMEWLRQAEILAPSEQINSDSLCVDLKCGDILLMLDSSWRRHREFLPVFARARQQDVSIITVIYDLLPITLPKSYFVQGGPEWFETWVQQAIDNSDCLLCISKTVSKSLIRYVESHCPHKNNLKVGYWHLGSNFRSNYDYKINKEGFTKIKSNPYLLVVGTIEPRKSHSLILESMELLWEKNINLNLCIAGKEGWLVEKLMGKIKKHPLRNKRLFFIDSPSDNEIHSLYSNAEGLLFLSVDEGFGLPLVEASHYGLPIICSDIPIFHEICKEFATYVKIDTPLNVSNAIIEWLQLKSLATLPDTRKMPSLTWEDSANQLVDIVLGDKWFWRN